MLCRSLRRRPRPQAGRAELIKQAPTATCLGCASDVLQCRKAPTRREFLVLSLRSPQGVATRNEGAGGELFQGCRSRKQEPLPGNTTQSKKRSDLRFNLDSLGYRIQP